MRTIHVNVLENLCYSNRKRIGFIDGYYLQLHTHNLLSHWVALGGADDTKMLVTDSPHKVHWHSILEQRESGRYWSGSLRQSVNASVALNIDFGFNPISSSVAGDGLRAGALLPLGGNGIRSGVGKKHDSRNRFSIFFFLSRWSIFVRLGVVWNLWKKMHVVGIVG